MIEDPVNSKPRSTKTLIQTGPWNTKSGGELRVLFNFTAEQLKTFTEAKSLHLLTGLRSYRVTGLLAQSVGANEWHKHRTELVFITRGSVEWICTDSSGKKNTWILSPYSDGLLIPPFTLHKYRALEDGCEILVITNTYFDPNNSTTHDTYSSDSFLTTQ